MEKIGLLLFLPLISLTGKIGSKNVVILEEFGWSPTVLKDQR